MLEADYPGNKIIVTAYQSGLLRCVQSINRDKKKTKGDDNPAQETAAAAVKSSLIDN